MHIDRLRLVGFKSFADAAEVVIGPGLTGIVGPNGCGKSNLAEALRWVMGENSARRLRGGAMDDVIFGGAAGRVARNLAEVTLRIDNRDRDAPFAFNDRSEIEVVRRIERGGGSTWQINGREVRAREVQMLFADAATGSGSGAIVTQGRVGALIEAKPGERRFLLEEAAGTAGIQARRRETEQKLAAAEDNLRRVDDVVATIAAQLAGLKRQARQAQRYRRLGEEIRRHQALLCLGRWLAARAEAEALAADLAAAVSIAAQAEDRAAAARAAQEAAEAALPPLRRADSEATAELQRLGEARGTLERELGQVVAARREAERRLAELCRDRQREAGQVAEADARLARFDAEERRLTQADGEDGPACAAAEDRLRAAGEWLAAAERELQRATETAATAQAQRAAFEARRHELGERRSRLSADLIAAERQRDQLAGEQIAEDARTAGDAAIAAAEAAVAGRRAVLDRAQRELAAQQEREAAAGDAARRAAAALARLEAEAGGLRSIVTPESRRDGVAMVHQMRVAAGFEAAIGALFDGELAASCGESDADGAFWIDLPPVSPAPALPHGARPLTDAVTAPSALCRSLAFAGLVESAEAGSALQPALAPGQRLVDRDGRLWRWDGYARGAADVSATAHRLRHQNRLAKLEGEIAAAQRTAKAAEAKAVSARRAREAVMTADRAARSELRDAEAALASTQRSEAELAARAAAAQARFEASLDRAAKLATDLAEAEAQSAALERSAAALPAAEPAAAALAGSRETAAAARREQAIAQAERDRLVGECRRRRERLSVIAGERRDWRQRRASVAGQYATLDARARELEQEIATLAARPAAIAGESDTLAARIAAVAAAARDAADRLASGEVRLRDAGAALRLAEQAAGELRERRARLEGQAEAANAALAALARDIEDRLGVAPAALRQGAGLAEGEQPPDLTATSDRLNRLLRERDGLGPVNLMAEDEAAGVAARLDALEGERADLSEAIARLRRGARALDAQGRALLAAAFSRLNEHFASLFARLFGGGQAELALTEDGDPLTAGLEIMANPTGKRLHSLSLLSGGEQALTALALLFAVFLTKPGPICVLDEVDAPLDDANVDRLCGLVAEIAETTGTRFLLITHHRITMARADRLFGVTMAESGVSQLVSVDLARAVRLRRTA